MQHVPSNLEMYTGLVAVFMPVIVAMIVQEAWSAQAKSATALVVSCLVGAGSAYFFGNFDGQDIVTCILIVFTVGLTTYMGFYKPTGIGPAIEAWTSRK